MTFICCKWNVLSMRRVITQWKSIRKASQSPLCSQGGITAKPAIQWLVLTDLLIIFLASKPPFSALRTCLVYGPSGYERNHLLAVVTGRDLDLGEPEEKERKDLPGPWPKGCQKVKGDGEGNGVRADCWLAYLESLWLKHYLSLPRGSD